MTPAEVGQAYAARRTYDEVMLRRPIYDAARMTSFFSMYPHVKKGALKQPADLWKFSWEQDADKVAKPEKLSNEELKHLMAQLDK